jgi:exodeoxyribonuclease V alpha subunit
MKDHLNVPMAAFTPLQTLTNWSELRWIRRLDSALARFICDLDPLAAGSPALLVSVAMLSYFEGHGHTCLSLRELVTAANALLGWPQDRQDALDALWQGAMS